MAFPGSDYPIVEMYIDGAWVNVSADGRIAAPDGQPAVRITRGTANEQTRISAQTCEYSIKNSDGKYSNRNPLSMYYGKIPRGTQVRVSAGPTTGEMYLRYRQDFLGTNADSCNTVDHSSLDITGDMELRVDIWPTSWRPYGTYSVIAAKYKQSGDQRSWILMLQNDGKLQFIWSTGGTTGTRVFAESTAAIPPLSGRLSIKVTLDVNNGAGGSTTAFYTASSIDGTYTQLGSNVVNAGVSSIFSSSAELSTGMSDDSANPFTGSWPFAGKFYKLRLYNGIAGSVVANPDFTTQTYGATSFVDSAGRTWNVEGDGNRITSDRYRFFGELSSMPQTWDTTGTDVRVPVTASGLLRRLTQGASPLHSPIYRAVIGKLEDLTGYWPLEDSSGTSSPSSALSGGRAGSAVSVTYASESTLPGSAPCVSMAEQSSKLVFTPAHTTNTGTVYVTFYVRLAGAVPSTDALFFQLLLSGTARRFNVSMNSTGFVFTFYSTDGTVLSNSSITYGGAEFTPNGQWLAFNVLLVQNGGNVDWYARWSNVAAESFVGVGPTSFAGTVGRLETIALSANNANLVNSSFAHMHSSDEDLDFVNPGIAQAANAYLSEPAAARMIRLAEEEGIAVEINGKWDDTEAMGYQQVATFPDLMYACADADGGLLAEARDRLALAYRTRSSMEHRRDVSLSYTSFHLDKVPSPTEDDQGVTNDVTVSRVGGGSARYVIESGATGVQDPPDGIGRYETAPSLAVAYDSRLPQIASWKANQGSVDEPRIPNLSVALHRTQLIANSDVTARMIALELGDTAAVTGMPVWLPPDDLLEIVRGYTEELGRFLWYFTLNTTPASAFDTGRYDDGTEVQTVNRYDHGTSTLNSSVNSVATTLSVALNSSTPTTVDRWTTDVSAFPFDIMIGGERMTVTSISGSTSPQSFTVTRSVNGIIKSHSAGARVRLFQPTRWGL